MTCIVVLESNYDIATNFQLQWNKVHLGNHSFNFIELRFDSSSFIYCTCNQ